MNKTVHTLIMSAYCTLMIASAFMSLPKRHSAPADVSTAAVGQAIPK